MRGYLRLALFCTCLAVPLGCGKAYKLVPVSGRVTLDNKPLAKAEVRFLPADAAGVPASSAQTDDQGHFRLHLATDRNRRGAVPGNFRVEISQDQRSNKLLMKGGKIPRKPGELLPAEYNRESKLTFTVPAEGTSEANFDLKSAR